MFSDFSRSSIKCFFGLILVSCVGVMLLLLLKSAFLESIPSCWISALRKRLMLRTNFFLRSIFSRWFLRPSLLISIIAVAYWTWMLRFKDKQLSEVDCMSHLPIRILTSFLDRRRKAGSLKWSISELLVTTIT